MPICDNGKLKYKDYSIDINTKDEMFYGFTSVSETGYKLISVTILAPVVGINIIQSCGIRGIFSDGVTYGIFGVANGSGTMKVRTVWIKN